MTTNHHTPLTTGAGATTTALNTVFSSLDSAITDLLKGDKTFNQQRFTAATQLTIAGGAVTASRSMHKIETEAAAASDDLATISGGSEGDLLFIRAYNTAHTVVVKHGTGNIYLLSGADFSLDDTEKMIMLVHNGTYWIGLGGGGGVDASGVTFTPGTLGDWTGSADPGDSDDALNQLASRVTTLEGAGGGAAYILIRDEKSSGTAGGTFTSGAWQTRTLNTEVIDTGGNASISSNQITLAAGTYEVDISAPAYECASHQTRLQNITDGTTELIGSSEYTGSTDIVSNRSRIQGRFTIAGSKVFEVQHRCSTTRSTSGFGVAASLGTEVYTIVEMRKVA